MCDLRFIFFLSTASSLALQMYCSLLSKSVFKCPPDQCSCSSLSYSHSHLLSATKEQTFEKESRTRKDNEIGQDENSDRIAIEHLGKCTSGQFYFQQFTSKVKAHRYRVDQLMQTDSDTYCAHTHTQTDTGTCSAVQVYRLTFLPAELLKERCCWHYRFQMHTCPNAYQ